MTPWSCCSNHEDHGMQIGGAFLQPDPTLVEAVAKHHDSENQNDHDQRQPGNTAAKPAHDQGGNIAPFYFHSLTFQ